MKIFITGATGFIGRHVLNQFCSEKHEILALIQSQESTNSECENIEWLIGDLEDVDALKPRILSFNPNVVIHLAWSGIPDYSEEISILNLNLSIRLFNFIIEETDCNKIVVSGSCFEYGSVQGECTEDNLINTTSYISWAKNSLYEFLQLKCTHNLIDLIWLRIFYVYGPGQRDGSLIPSLINSINKNEVPDIRSPFSKNDFIYISDVAEAFIDVIKSKIESGVYNIANGYSTSVCEVCEIVEKTLKGSTIITEGLNKEEQNEKIDFWGNISKATNAFCWKPKYSLTDGIKETIEFGKLNNNTK